MHWSDDPRKSKAWAKQKKHQTANDAIWAAEYDIDYSASVEGVAIPGTWVQSARLLADMVVPDTVGGTAGFDVGAGKAESCLISRRGMTLIDPPIAWADPDTINGAHKALEAAKASGITLLNYDPVGVGHGVVAVLDRANTEGLEVQALNVGVPASKREWPDGRTSEEMFANLKAELWWLARERFNCSHERYLWETGAEGGIKHPLSDCIVLPEDNALQTQLSLVKWLRNEKGKIAIESKDKLKARGVASPDRADALVLALAEDMTPRTIVRSFPFD
jgi:hypothetical protein